MTSSSSLLQKIVLLVVVVATTIIVTTFTEAAPSQVFPSRFRDTPPFEKVVEQERSYGLLSKNNHVVNKSVNWFDVPLYHSGKTGEETFKARWYYDTTFGDASGDEDIILVYGNGEAPCTSTPGGSVLDAANATKSAIIVMENRWYGESIPQGKTLSDMNKLNNNLTLVLEDFNFLTKYVEEKVFKGKNLRFYFVGGSYSGGCAAWIKARYPQRFEMAWSSSGVVHPILDFTAFDGHVKSVIQREAFEAWREAFEQFSILWDQNKTHVVRDLLNTSDVFLTSKQDTAWMISDGSAMIVQYGGKDHISNILMDRQFQPRSDIATPYNDKLLRLVYAIQTFWGKRWLESLDVGCYYSTECLSKSSYSKHWGPAGYTWVFQVCTQFGWFQPGYHNSLRLGDVLKTDYWVYQCRSMLHDDTLIPSVYTFNAAWGGVTPKSPVTGEYATRVAATVFEDDTWYGACAHESVPSREYYVKMAMCHGCGHCQDLMAPHPTDPPQLVAQREWTMSKILEWTKNKKKQQEKNLDL